MATGFGTQIGFHQVWGLALVPVSQFPVEGLDSIVDVGKVIVDEATLLQPFVLGELVTGEREATWRLAS